ncbi:MAG: hypothetical protein IKU84_06900, partial [Clostridia bacterium]|nr:hypothetical protein [Clostridia bacterium]
MAGKFSFKRILSAVLAFCMILGAMPSVALFDAQAAGTDLYYNFIKGNIGTGMGTAHVKTITYANTTAGNEAELNPTIASEPWEVRTASAGVDGGGGYFAYINNGKGLYLYGNDYKAAADTYYGEIKIKVPAAGKYIPQVNFSGSSNWSYESTCIAYLYDYDADLNTLGDKLAEKTVGYHKYDLPNHYVSLTNKPITMDAGEYVFKVAIVGNSNGTVVVDGLKLVDASEATATDMVIGVEEGLYTVKIGESVSVPLTATMSDGSKADLTKATFEYSTADVATAEIVDGALKITAGEAAGTTTLTVKLGAAMARTNIAVVEEYAAPHDLTYSFIKPAVQGSDKKMYNQAYVESLILG